MASLTNIWSRLTRASGLRWFALGLLARLLAALGAWPTPGALWGSESKRQER